MASGQTYGAEPILARAHHGSVSKEARAEVEDALKSGRLKAVVATSSLELGIDMGAVDLVIQVETPPSVASGLQRDRAGRPSGRRDQPGRAVPQAPHRPDRLRGQRAADAGRPDRDDAGTRQSARRAGPAHSGGVRAGADQRRQLVRHRAPQRAVRDAAAQRIRGDLGSAVREVPVDGVRRVATAHRLRPRRRHPDRAAGRSAPGRHLRRRDPRPRPVHRLPGLQRRLRKALPGRRTR